MLLFFCKKICFEKDIKKKSPRAEDNDCFSDIKFQWSGRQDLNLRHLVPKTSTLPD